MVEQKGNQNNIHFLLNNASIDLFILPKTPNLKRLGIDMKVRVVDTGQYINRLREFDFDMIVGGWGQSETPGNEQREYWSCAAADRPGSRNSAGICHPVVDELIEKIVLARTREELISITRAMDRVLLWQNYVVPNWHLPADRILWWNKFSRPDVPLRNGVNTNRWWVDDAKAERLREARANGEITQGTSVSGGENGEKPSGWRLWLLAGIIIFGVFLMRRATGKRNKQTSKGET